MTDYKTLCNIAIRSIIAPTWLALHGLSSAASPAWLTAHDAEIKSLVSQMTLAEKAGQMTQPDLGAIKDFSDIENLFLGSILSGGSSDPKSGNTLKDWADLYESCQKRALKTRLAIPLLYGVDAVHGHNNVLGAVVFPHNIGLGCTGNPEIVEKAAHITAKEVRATGIQWTFAPCVTVPRDIRWGRTYEGFSENPELVAKLGLAAVRGLQGTDLSAPTAALGCAKHFIGDGGTTFKSVTGEGLLDQGDVRLDEATLRAIHLTGYPAAVDAGVGTIMPSYSSWNGVKCSGSKFLLTDMLKKELGFEGFIISDYNAIDQIIPPAKKENAAESNNASGQEGTADYKKCIEISINAGMDMVMVTDKYRDFIKLLQELVNEGKIPMERIDDAVTRILRVKFAQGLMKKDAALMADAALQKEFGSDAHRAVAREAVRQSLALLKNDNKTLPLSRKAKRIHITGRGANDVGMQCGGWTVDWQGKLGEVTPGGTSILGAIQKTAGPDMKVTTSKDGSGAEGADVAIVVIGENPYAEMKGDTEDLAVSKEDAAAVAAAKATGVPVAVVILSGRPIILGEIATQADAIVAAWLPGTEGTGIADVLFGDYAPTGKLAFTWPRSMDQVPLGHGKPATENPLFPYGFGLGY
jgi:beta-glucosidase